MRDLLTGVETLGLDTQPLRDFQAAAQSGQVNDKNYIHILTTLDDQVLKALSGVAETMAVQLILKRLDKKLNQELDGPVEIVQRQVVIGAEELQELIKAANSNGTAEVTKSTDQTDVNQQILHQLRMVTEEVKGMKSGQFHTILPTDSSNVSGPESVFVNPIDESKVNELETNITIKSKTSQSNLKDKVRRLRELKNGKEEEN